MSKAEIIYDLLQIANECLGTYCPCCGGDECEDGCTYPEDDPVGYEGMQFNRDLADRLLKLRESIEKL